MKNISTEIFNQQGFSIVQKAQKYIDDEAAKKNIRNNEEVALEQKLSEDLIKKMI